jgi:hypothetical protein
MLVLVMKSMDKKLGGKVFSLLIVLMVSKCICFILAKANALYEVSIYFAYSCYECPHVLLCFSLKNGMNKVKSSKAA